MAGDINTQENGIGEDRRGLSPGNDAERALASARGLIVLVAAAALVLALVAVDRAHLYFVLPTSPYLVVHTLTEVVSIVVGFSIFAVHWHGAVAGRLRQRQALFLGAIFLGVALVDTLHIMAFPGMPGVFGPSSTDRGIYFWLAGRLWASLGLLAAGFIPGQSRSPLLRRGPLLAATLGALALLLLGDFLMPPSAQYFYVEGVGLTPFKVALEYLVIAVSLAGAIVYWRRYRQTLSRPNAMLAAALALTILGELSFTLYSQAYDTFNLLGHVYKAVAYYLVFDALFVSALIRPYLELDATSQYLAASNRELSRLRDHIQGELAQTITRLEERTTAERRARESAETLAKLARDIAAQVEVRQLLGTLVAELRAIFGADLAAVVTIDRPSGVTKWHAVDGARGDLFSRVAFASGSGIAGLAIEAGAPLVLERLGNDPPHALEQFPVLAAEGVHSVLAVPMRTGEGVSGALLVAHRRDHHFSVEEKALAGGIADQAAVVLENARLYDAVNRQAAELDAVISSIADGVIVYHPDGAILRLNAAARRILGYRDADLRLSMAERVAGISLTDPQGRQLSPAETPPGKALARGETTVGQEVALQGSDGSLYRLSVSAAPVRDPEGQLLGVVATLHDITRMVELEAKREEFVSLVAHDIRQPLAVIQGQGQMLQMALRVGKTERAQSSAEAIVVSAKRMGAMIRDLVDSARLEMGQLELVREPLDLHSFVAELLARLAGTPGGQRLRLAESDGLAPVWADPDRLERILGNLVSNAVKYSPPESEVVVSLAEREGMAQVAVSDRGQGISPEDLSHVFERLFRASDEHRRESLGLGLYITRMLVEAHGGRIWVESRVGEGSTFYLTLPLAPSR